MLFLLYFLHFRYLFLLSYLAIGCISAMLNFAVGVVPLFALGAEDPGLAVHLGVILPRKVHLEAVVALLVGQTQIVAILAQTQSGGGGARGACSLILQLHLVKYGVSLLLFLVYCTSCGAQSCRKLRFEWERSSQICCMFWYFASTLLRFLMSWLLLTNSCYKSGCWWLAARLLIHTAQPSSLHFGIVGAKLVVTSLFNASEDGLVKGRVSLHFFGTPSLRQTVFFIVQITFYIGYF